MDWKEIAVAIGGLWLGVVSFVGRRELARLDGKADKTDLAAALAKLNEHIEEDRELRKELSAGLNKCNDVLRDTQNNVARILGRLEHS